MLSSRCLRGFNLDNTDNERNTKSYQHLQRWLSMTRLWKRRRKEFCRVAREPRNTGTSTPTNPFKQTFALPKNAPTNTTHFWHLPEGIVPVNRKTKKQKPNKDGADLHDPFSSNIRILWYFSLIGLPCPNRKTPNPVHKPKSCRTQKADGSSHNKIKTFTQPVGKPDNQKERDITCEISMQPHYQAFTMNLLSFLGGRTTGHPGNGKNSSSQNFRWLIQFNKSSKPA